MIADHGNAALHLDVYIFPIQVIQPLEVCRFRKRVWLLVPAVHHHKAVRKPHFLAGAPAGAESVALDLLKSVCCSFKEHGAII